MLTTAKGDITGISGTRVIVVTVDRSGNAISIHAAVRLARVIRRARFRSGRTSSIRCTDWKHAWIRGNTGRSSSALTSSARINRAWIIVIAYRSPLAAVGEVTLASVSDARIRGLEAL